MKLSIRKGLGFGLTSGVITTIGLIVGLYSSTSSKLAVIGGILSIAIADAFSDALGMHVSEESVLKDGKSVWEATVATFFSKFIFAITFLIPFLIFQLANAVTVSIVWAFVLIIIYNYRLAKREKIDPLKVISEHLVIAVLVVFITYYLGKVIDFYFF